MSAVANFIDAASSGGSDTAILRAKAAEAFATGRTDYASPHPRAIRVQRAVALAVLALWVALTASTLADVRETVASVGHDTVPSIVAAERVRSLLADADSQFADALLANDGDDGRFAAAFRQDIRDAETSLATAAQNVTFGDEERGPILTMLRGLAEYDGLVGQARATARSTGKASMSDAARADTLMHFTLLPAAAALDRVNFEHLDEGYASHVKWATALIIASGVLGVGAIVGILVAAVAMSRRTRRVLDPFLAIAMACVAVATVAGIVQASRAEYDLRVAKSDAFESVHALAKARAVANDANSAESMWLLATGDAAAQADWATRFSGRTRTILGGDAGQALADAKAGRKITGLLGDELANVTFPGEANAARGALAAWGEYMGIDRRMRSMEVSGDHAGAVAVDVGTGPNQSDWAFERFGRALDAVTAINGAEFDSHIGSAMREVPAWLPWGVTGAFAAACACVWAAAAQRLRAYEF